MCKHYKNPCCIKHKQIYQNFGEVSASKAIKHILNTFLQLQIGNVIKHELSTNKNCSLMVGNGMVKHEKNN